MKPEPDALRQILNPPPLFPPLFPAGLIRGAVEDFEVEELPAYFPEGTGEHSYLWIEKRGLSAGDLISRLARTLRISPQDIGFAGQKDRHAVTRQFVSVPRRCAACPVQLAASDIRVLAVSAHRNKLRTGHLKGNRFRIIVRHPDAHWTDADARQISERLRQISQSGFPSYFGTQRFGHAGSTLRDGIALLQGQLSRRRWPFQRQRMMTRLVLSAVQSAAFNLVVSARVSGGTVGRPVAGDVVIRKDGTRPFLLLAGPMPGLLPAGPMPGPGMLATTGSVAAAEAVALEQLGLSGEEFRRYARLCGGTRRPMLAFPADCSAERTPEGHLRIDCELGGGTYVTVLLREIFASLVDAAAVGPEQPDEEQEEGERQKRKYQ